MEKGIRTSEDSARRKRKIKMKWKGPAARPPSLDPCEIDE
jgi:hypothetical protein